MSDLQMLEHGGFPVIFLMICVLLLIESCKSEVYKVGDEAGWDSGFDYGSWSRKYNFTAGDVLVFNYTKNQHNVYEVTQETFRSCEASTGVLKIYENGNDEITLNETKSYWFICNIAGHCFGGMRFTIDVQEDANGSNNDNNNTESVPTPEMLEPSDGYCVSFALGKWAIGIYLFAFVINSFEIFC